MTWLSYLPFSAPTAMPVRLFKGDTVGWWEPLLSLGLLAATGVGFVLLAARRPGGRVADSLYRVQG